MIYSVYIIWERIEIGETLLSKFWLTYFNLPGFAVLFFFFWRESISLYVYIQRVPGRKVNILGGPSIGHSKQKKKKIYIYAYIYVPVSYSEWFPR
jgi:hypothetical protein